MGQLRIIQKEELQQHQTKSSCWVVHQHHVYDITSFLPDHPGGPELILEHLHQNMTQAMNNALIHEHSESAYTLLSPFVIGVYEGASSSDTPLPLTQDFLLNPLVETEASLSLSSSDSLYSSSPKLLSSPTPFLNIHAPLFPQLMQSTFTKAFYLEHVHVPRYLPKPCTIFQNPCLELLTRTPWYFVPMVWIPFTMYLFMQGMNHFDPHTMWLPWPGVFLLCWCLGMMVWTFCEYTFHRFLFHMDRWLPEHRYAYTLHFLLHGIHHFLPMDPMRLVLPPVLFALLLQPAYWGLYVCIPSTSVHAFAFIGAIHAYIVYDVMHYALHHLPSSTTRVDASRTTQATVPTSLVSAIHRPTHPWTTSIRSLHAHVMKYLNQMRSYHLAHHYKNYITGFGITSTFWDSVFGTLGDSGMIRTSTSTPPPNHSAPLSSSSSTSYGTSKRVN